MTARSVNPRPPITPPALSQALSLALSLGLAILLSSPHLVWAQNKGGAKPRPVRKTSFRDWRIMRKQYSVPASMIMGKAAATPKSRPLVSSCMASFGGLSPADAAVLQRVKTQRISLNLAGVDFPDVIGFFRDITQMKFDASAVKKPLKIHVQARDLRLFEAFFIIERRTDLHFVLRDGVIHVQPGGPRWPAQILPPSKAWLLGSKTTSMPISQLESLLETVSGKEMPAALGPKWSLAATPAAHLRVSKFLQALNPSNNKKPESSARKVQGLGPWSGAGMRTLADLEREILNWQQPKSSWAEVKKVLGAKVETLGIRWHKDVDLSKERAFAVGQKSLWSHLKTWAESESLVVDWDPWGVTIRPGWAKPRMQSLKALHRHSRGYAWFQEHLMKRAANTKFAGRTVGDLLDDLNRDRFPREEPKPIFFTAKFANKGMPIKSKKPQAKTVGERLKQALHAQKLRMNFECFPHFIIIEEGPWPATKQPLWQQPLTLKSQVSVPELATALTKQLKLKVIFPSGMFIPERLALPKNSTLQTVRDQLRRQLGMSLTLAPKSQFGSVLFVEWQLFGLRSLCTQYSQAMSFEDQSVPGFAEAKKQLQTATQSLRQKVIEFEALVTPGVSAESLEKALKSLSATQEQCQDLSVYLLSESHRAALNEQHKAKDPKDAGRAYGEDDIAKLDKRFAELISEKVSGQPAESPQAKKLKAQIVVAKAEEAKAKTELDQNALKNKLARQDHDKAVRNKAPRQVLEDARRRLTETQDRLLFAARNYDLQRRRRRDLEVSLSRLSNRSGRMAKLIKARLESKARWLGTSLAHSKATFECYLAHNDKRQALAKGLAFSKVFPNGYQRWRRSMITSLQSAIERQLRDRWTKIPAKK